MDDVWEPILKILDDPTDDGSLPPTPPPQDDKQPTEEDDEKVIIEWILKECERQGIEDDEGD